MSNRAFSTFKLMRIMKKFIEGINLSSMINDESFEFHTSLSKYYKAAGCIETSAVEMDYFLALVKYDDALKQVRENDKTILLAKLDAARDRLYSVFVRLAKVLQEHYDEEIATAAHSVNIVIRNYRNPVSMSYAAETSVLYNLCQDLQEPAYAPSVEKVGLTGWVEKLKETNDEFEKVFDERIDAKSLLIVNAAKDCRIKLEDAYRLLMTVTESELLKETCNIHPYVDKINTLIADYKKLIAARTTRNATKRKKKDDEKNNGGEGEGPIEI